MQKTIENGVTVLTADSGMRLTDDFSYVTTVRLGKEDTGECWYEITEAEALEREAEAFEEATEADYQAALADMGVKL